MLPTMTVVRVRDLTKSYGEVAAVRGISFEIHAGEVLGLLGPNGAGKTTVLECILGLRTPDAGEVRVDGDDVARSPTAARSRFGAVLQTTALQDRITPREALRLFAALHARPAARAEHLLQEFALIDKAESAFETLSGGQRQRLALALAFVHQPRVVVLDEPTTGLDPAARRDLHARIAGKRSAGCAVLLSTHDMAEAERVCDRVAILHEGQIAALGPPAALVSQSGARATLRLRTAAPVAPADVTGLPGMVECSEADDVLTVHTTDPTETLAALTALLSRRGVGIFEMHVSQPGLEDAFLRLTGATITPVSKIP